MKKNTDKIVMVALDDIMETFVVRVVINHDRVKHLVDLICSGVELPPLLLSDDDKELIDGRHRKLAYKQIGIAKVACVLRRFASKAEKIIEAFGCNCGGSLPPTPDDINHTMEILLVSGESRRSIIESIGFRTSFPAKLIAKHLDEVQSNIAKARINRAVNAVVNGGLSVHDAAIKEGVKLESLKKALKPSAENDKPETSVIQSKSGLSTHYASLQHRQGKVLSSAFKALKDGILSPEEAKEILRHLEKLAKRSNHNRDEWVKRFGLHVATATEIVKTTEVRPQRSQKLLEKVKGMRA